MAVKINKYKGKLRRYLGQGMTEYIIIVALIAVASIVVYRMFGEVVQNQTAAIAAELGGQNGDTAVTRAGTAGTTATKTAKASDVQLNNYTSENQTAVN